MENKEKIQGLSIVMNGITINGPMFDIHDNKEVHNHFITSDENKLNSNVVGEEMIPEQEQPETPLRNHIFIEKIFDTNERLLKLRNTIASAIDMGEATIMYGKPQDYRINAEAQNEWYYIVKAIEEAGVAKNFAITHFIEQMQEWFPTLFSIESKEEWEKLYILLVMLFNIKITLSNLHLF